MPTNKVLLSHGDGGLKTSDLINNVFLKNYGAVGSEENKDSFVFLPSSSKLAFTTDSFVVKPIFFKGGDIGKLSICGTINDLVTAGAKPAFISAGFIIEEGFEIDTLSSVAKSMDKACKNADVRIVTGDTKVVEKGSVDGIFINTSGIGTVSEHFSPQKIVEGDEIIITGTIAEHGTAILLERYDFQFETTIFSDCGSLNWLIDDLGEDIKHVKLMRDPTRGGLGTILNEIVLSAKFNAELIESQIPINNQVKAINEILGIDPMYLASEGRMVMVVEKGFGKKILECIKKNINGKDASIIGRFTDKKQSLVYINTSIGGKRIIPSLEGQTVPRIC